MPYLGRGPGFGIRQRYFYTASADDTSVSGSDNNGITLSFTDTLFVDVFLNGVLLDPNSDYNTTTANTIAGLAALSANDFIEQPKVINGASDLIVSIFGDAGMHTRAAVSTNSLPLGVAVEVDAIFELN